MTKLGVKVCQTHKVGHQMKAGGTAVERTPHFKRSWVQLLPGGNAIFRSLSFSINCALSFYTCQ